MIDTQKGVVYQNTMMRARGAKGAARLSITKLAYPVKNLQNKACLLSLGNYLNGP